MVLQREGRGKISSPHSVNILGTKILPRWGGMIWIVSSFNFSSILLLYGWKNWRNWIAIPILVEGPNLENWGP
jgi:hypothetical protein